MTPLAAVPNLIQQAYDRILTAIVDHSLAPGSRIRQLELAERLGVSRQPVSHALHLLHRQGLVVESGRKGFQVTPLEGAGIRRLYAVRGALDGLAASLAAGRAAHDAAGRAALEAALTTGQATDAAAPLADLIETSRFTARSTACQATLRSPRRSVRNGPLCAARWPRC